MVEVGKAIKGRKILQIRNNLLITYDVLCSMHLVVKYVFVWLRPCSPFYKIPTHTILNFYLSRVGHFFKFFILIDWLKIFLKMCILTKKIKI